MRFEDLYRERVGEQGGRWTASACLWARAAERIIDGRGSVNVQALREARGSGSYSTALKQLERMEHFGVLVAHKHGHRTKVWTKPGQAAPLAPRATNGPTPGRRVAQGIASRERAARALPADEPTEGRGRGLGELARYEAPELREPRGAISVARWHAERAAEAARAAVRPLSDHGYDQRAVASLLEMVGELDLLRDRLGAVAGVRT